MIYNFIKNKKTLVSFSEGDYALLRIPQIDRSGTDNSHLPVKIHEIIKLGNGHQKYRLITKYGILDICYSADDLKPSNIVVVCDVEDSVKVPLATAARSYNSRSTPVRTTCRCKMTCMSSKCKCKAAGFKCSTHCHAFSQKCLNKDSDSD